jgi:hypothetical protein
MSAQQPQSPTSGHRKRKSVSLGQQFNDTTDTTGGAEVKRNATAAQTDQADTSAQEPKIKKSRTNTPWTPAEELRLKQMRDTGNSWSEIAKVSDGFQVDTSRGSHAYHNRYLYMTTDLSTANRRKCQEALVQSM